MDDELKQKDFYFRIRYVDEPPYFRIRFVDEDKAIIESCLTATENCLTATESVEHVENKETENDE